MNYGENAWDESAGWAFRLNRSESRVEEWQGSFISLYGRRTFE